MGDPDPVGPDGGLPALTVGDLWRGQRGDVIVLFVSTVGLFVSVFVAGATSPWVFLLTAAFFLLRRKTIKGLIPDGQPTDHWRRAILILTAVSVVGGFVLAILTSPLLLRLFG